MDAAEYVAKVREMQAQLEQAQQTVKTALSYADEVSTQAEQVPLEERVELQLEVSRLYTLSAEAENELQVHAAQQRRG